MVQLLRRGDDAASELARCHSDSGQVAESSVNAVSRLHHTEP